MAAYTVDPLPPNYTYVGPWEGYGEPCSCCTVTWSLFAACGTCQNGTPIAYVNDRPVLRSLSLIPLPDFQMESVVIELFVCARFCF